MVGVGAWPILACRGDRGRRRRDTEKVAPECCCACRFERSAEVAGI